MRIRHAWIRAFALVLALVGLASSVYLETKAGSFAKEESHNNAGTLGIFSSYRAWTKKNEQPMVFSIDQLGSMAI